MEREKLFARPTCAVFRDSLFRPDPDVKKRTCVGFVRKIVAVDREYFIFDNQRLYQTANHYEIRDAENAGLIAEIPLIKVLWIVPVEIPGWYDFEKKVYNYFYD